MPKANQGVLKLLDRYRGALLGLAAGDALGTTLEFRAPGTFEPIDDMHGGGPFNLRPGEWTDDTSMALCLAESLITCGEFDPVDQLARYVRWKREGYHSSNGTCFDVGGTVRAALARFERYSEPWSGSTDEFSAGNGSIMRLAPVPLFFARTPGIAIARSADSSRTTHGAREAIDACRYLAGLIIGALQGTSKDDLLAPLFTPISALWIREPLAPKVHAVAAGSFLEREPPEIRGSGYVVESLEAALWAFAKSRSFEHGALLAVNLGDDADTTGAVYGQIAGAYYGARAIPEKWRSKLAHRETLESFAERLYEGAVPKWKRLTKP
jgi:ADP-ribosyl-[dinitrogen reductase] hydrolase